VRVCAIELPARWNERAKVLADVERELSQVSPGSLVLLPEACLDGYMSPRAEFDLSPFAEAPDGPACQALAALARRHACHLAGSFVEKDGAHCYNALAVFGPDGAVVARYRKRHPWVIEEWATPGDAPPPVFDVGGLRVTVAMCYDVHFLEEDATSQLREADVLLFPSAWVEEAADQIRKERRLARDCSSAGSTVSRRWSNGILSRKKKVSLVVMASTTSVVSTSAPDLIFCTSSGIPASPTLRASGTSRLSTRYCLSAERSRPERSFRSLRRNS